MKYYEIIPLQEKIIKEVRKIENLWILQQIWQVVENIQK